MNKCTLSEDGKIIAACARLAEATEFDQPRGKKKGVFLWDFENAKTGARRTMYGVKSGTFVKDGLLFNFCPFCGEKIDSPFAEE